MVAQAPRTLPRPGRGPRRRGRAHRARMRESPVIPATTLHHLIPMDIEQVNAVGTLLADLSARTEQLRGYL